MSNHARLQSVRFLADPRSERAARGIGIIAQSSGRPAHALLRDALGAVSCLPHRGARVPCNHADAGILTQTPYALFERDSLARVSSRPIPGSSVDRSWLHSMTLHRGANDHE